jgi:multidrug resistance efflux pump
MLAFFEDTEIKAPFAGRLGRSLVNESPLMSAAGTPLSTLVQLDPIYVTFNPRRETWRCSANSGQERRSQQM